MSDLNLAINIKAVDNASSAMSSLANGIGTNFSSAFGNIKFALQNIGTEGTLTKDALMSAGADMGKALLGVGVAAAGVALTLGTKAVQAASQFQTGLTSLSTGAGETQSNLKMVGDGILDLSVKTGTGTKQLTDGMYMIESAGYHGADGLKVLQAAAEGAKVGNADLGTVANGVTTVMTDFASSNINATQATNTLVATVASGKTTMQDLSSSLSGILPTASAAGVGLTDVMSAMATMTGEGVPAANAATYLRQTIMNLSAPSKGTSDALKNIGLSAEQVSDGIKTSLPNTLHMITEALGKKFPEGSLQYNEALSKIAGGSKQLQGILDLTGSHANTFAQNFDHIDNAVTGTGSKITGFDQVQQNFSFKMDQAKQATNALMISLGTALLPILGKLLDNVTPIITGFMNWENKTHGIENAINTVVGVISNLATGIGNVIGFFQHNEVAMNALKSVLIAVGIVILAIVVPAFIAWAISAASAAISTIILFAPLIALIAIIALVVFGIIEAVQHWGQIVAWLKGVWGGISSWFSGVLNAVKVWFTWLWATIRADIAKAWQAIQNVVKIALQVLVNIVMGPIFAIAGFFIWLYQHNTYFKKLVDAIVDFFKACIAWIMSAWQAVSAWLAGVWQAVVKFATDLWNQISKAIHDGFFAAVGFVQSVWATISSFFVNAWNTYIAGPLTTLWNNVSGVFSSAWNTYIATPLNNIWTSISQWFTDLGTNATSSGKNFITMLVSGIASGAGAIWNAVVNIANTIWRALGFHSPAKEGPGADADTWMPNLVNMLSADLTAGIPKIQAAVNLVAKPLAALGSPQAATTGTADAPATTTNNGGDIAIHVHLGDSGTGTDAQRRGKDIADVVKRELAKHLRQQSVAPRYTSGGTHS